MSSHTGGKWKPGNSSQQRPQNMLQRSTTSWEDRSPQWQMPPEVVVEEKTEKDTEETEPEADRNPPPEHTRGKWIPGTKHTKLEYKPEVQTVYKRHYWCNTCNRKLASKHLFERHLKSNYHRKRAQPENELEKAKVEKVETSERIKTPSKYLNPSVYVVGTKPKKRGSKTKGPPSSIKKTKLTKKRNRRKLYTRCETCKMRFLVLMLGKHLISHYHYRRMVASPQPCYDSILDNINEIIYQSPYQCQPCRFYANTELEFLRHWDSKQHREHTEGPGIFWCNFCKFECEDNNQLRRHLMSSEHAEVILTVNRSVPIVIRKRVVIECNRCKHNFRYNIELRKHAAHCTAIPTGSASNDYQSKFECSACKTVCKSMKSLQHHQLAKHQVTSFFCSLCRIKFKSAEHARKHRNSAEHKIKVASVKKGLKVTRRCTHCNKVLENLLKLKKHIDAKHPDQKPKCPHCGERFTLSQELCRHIRIKGCQATMVTGDGSPSGTKENTQGTEDGTKINTEPPLPYIFVPIPPADDPKFTSDVLVTPPDEIMLPLNSVIEMSSECPVVEINQDNIQSTAKGSTTVQPVDNSSKSEFLTCQQCPFRTLMKAELLYHEVCHSGDAPKIQCPVCKKPFPKRSLRFHLRHHTNEKIFTCDHCGQGFARKHNLKNHVDSIHKEVKPHRHKAKEKKFICDICHKSFSRR